MIDIPKSFELAGRKWTVMVCTEDEARAHHGSDLVFEETSGYCSNTNATIYIIEDEREDGDFKRLIFWHELVHALLMAKGVYDTDHDEREVESFAQFLHQFDKSRKGKVNL